MMNDAQTGNITGHNTIASALTNIVTGKEDANFSSPNGKYNFFTCSSNTLKCDEYAFNASSILIAGNGEFNVKHYTGKFNAYQRTYVLIPDLEYYALLYLASMYQIKSFKSAASGSIVKFITKGDIENIPVFIPDNKAILNNASCAEQFFRHALLRTAFNDTLNFVQHTDKDGYKTDSHSNYSSAFFV